MNPKKKKSKRKDYPRKRKHGTWFTVGQIFIILGAVLMIILSIVFLINDAIEGIQSYTFGLLGVPYLGQIMAIIMGILILWLTIDRRVYYRLNLYLFAILIIVLAIIGGNVGGLVCVIGGLIIIFYRISKE
ncbi:MAG: hypothetical protein FK730_09665 [Asgard group archaeon]|nr:hypothetical protein [Asgard group archaeon]